VETEFYWSGGRVVTGTEIRNNDGIPALSMAEAWRELKARGQFPCSDGDNFWLYDNNDADDISPEISDPNPTDALISLIIWTRKEGR
jgi:hypothetical protein